MDKYQYHPIESPDKIRMLELLPGQDDEPIQIKISHRSLADLPLCEALSYEWGSPTRDHEIICEGKSLRVTPNLMVALLRLRPATQVVKQREETESLEPSRLLWVDALCINQDDIDERSEQVKLMGDIYRNAGRTLAWIGEAPPDFAQEIFEPVEELASIAQRLEIDKFGTSGRIRAPQTVEIRPDYYLKHLLDDDIWPSLVYILASPYFDRLWTLQEIVLSSVDKTTVYCGAYSVSWRMFRDAALLVDYSGILVHDLELRKELTGLFNITCQAQLQDNFQAHGSAPVLECVRATYTRSATELRDRIVGFVGMLHTDDRSELQDLNYSTSLGRIL